ncbi:hypothetical protein [Marivita cryptomonadis]|uniref:hypothetical protein n=1 Tax=Marivita cryptomonadis TaxID=505252 RepID=UPI000A1F8EF8|nr:hypothetical protein MCRY_16955 [Marivita cryptomonadis]
MQSDDADISRSEVWSFVVAARAAPHQSVLPTLRMAITAKAQVSAGQLFPKMAVFADHSG